MDNIYLAMEELYVRDTYNQIAEDFSKTRYKPWPSVVKFINSLEKGCLVLDAGCGNGKNMQIRDDLKYIGCDTSDELIKICTNKGFKVVNANIKSLPFPDNHFDHIMCIAVLHHIAEPKDRIDAVRELLRVLKPGGMLALQVWASEQEITDKFIHINGNDFFVTWGTKDKITKRYYHLFSELEIKQLLAQLDGINIIDKFYEKDNWCVVLKKI